MVLGSLARKGRRIDVLFFSFVHSASLQVRREPISISAYVIVVIDVAARRLLPYLKRRREPNERRKGQKRRTGRSCLSRIRAISRVTCSCQQNCRYRARAAPYYIAEARRGELRERCFLRSPSRRRRRRPRSRSRRSKCFDDRLTFLPCLRSSPPPALLVQLDFFFQFLP